MLLTDELFLQYQRCHRRTFLDIYGDSAQRRHPPDYLQKIIVDTDVHRQKTVTRYVSAPSAPAPATPPSGAAETLKLMQQGVDTIYRGVLKSVLSEDVTLVSKPDLLLKQAGRSNLGDWHYLPVQIKLGRRPKLEYQMSVTFQSFVLAEVQQCWPAEAWLVLKDQKRFTVSFAERLLPMRESLTSCLEMLQNKQEPEVFISRNRCSLCVWLNYCSTIAHAEHHLSLLPGVTPKRYATLKGLDLTSLKSLAKANPQQLSELPGFGEEVAERMVDQARSTLTNQPLLYRLPSQPLPASSTVELYFDIEAQPDIKLAYLHGILRVEPHKQRQTFHGFLAEQPDQEARVWQQFLELALSYPHAPIYHFCTYEVEAVKRLASLYGLDATTTRRLLDRFVDIHAWVTRTVTLPVQSYALKPIAQWVGFRWRQEEANGAQAICWYEQWLETGDRNFLDKILCYNEDDCRATYYVKQWLANFLNQTISCA